ncbi:MAG: hypothetical protein K2X77_29790 [Candidatus Obscuribacterales bacterium]|nr:hypothetical protein [Candidatus Obscuribacterales bacterium]
MLTRQICLPKYPARPINVCGSWKLIYRQTKAKTEDELDTLENNPEAKQTIDDLTKLVPALKGLKVDVRKTSNLNRFWQADAEKDPSSLLVVPVTEMGGVRKTTFGTSPDTIVRYLNHPAVLFWMEETEVEIPKEEKASSAV